MQENVNDPIALLRDMERRARGGNAGSTDA